jgi:hypothetical protein
MLDPAVRRVLDGTSIAHLATICPDGSPHSTPVYVGAHGDRSGIGPPGWGLAEVWDLRLA